MVAQTNTAQGVTHVDHHLQAPHHRRPRRCRRGPRGQRRQPAATVIHKPGTGTTVVASQPTTVAQDIDPSKVGAGGSGQSTDEQCEDLANEINSLNNDAQSNLSGNDISGFDLAVAESALASEETQQLNDNCLVID